MINQPPPVQREVSGKLNHLLHARALSPFIRRDSISAPPLLARLPQEDAALAVSQI